uniref:Uncharacterized protein n=1 Tax=Helianthus annuus TaxID=4232 RepID=A0A251T252_HELAN
MVVRLILEIGSFVSAIFVTRALGKSEVTKCESQIEASWTALKAWKSGNKVT